MSAVLRPKIALAQPSEETSPAANSILGANPFVGLGPQELLRSVGDFFTGLAKNPARLSSPLTRLCTDLLEIVTGTSAIEPDDADKRFTDPTWAENPLYRAMMQTYLAWRAAMHQLAAGDDGAEVQADWKNPAQRNFAVTLLTEALAPTNVLFGNPAALKRTFETGGLSLVEGMRHFADDLLHNGGMPSQVDKRPFKVGENLAVTPGAVIHRADLYELLQYRPANHQVFERPVLLVPPQINKYYVMDLAHGRSLTEHAVDRGVQFFTISWRNPGPEYRDRGLDDYVSAIKEAIGVVCEVTASPDINLLGVCAGGITSSLALGHLAAIGDRRVASGTLAVTMLDSSQPSMTGMFATEESVKAACLSSQEKGVLDAAALGRIFAWLRPNDLVWHYWVNNYLMGKDPAPFDILYWNADSTNLPARLHAGFLDLLLRNPLVEADRVTVLSTPIDLRKVVCDMYIVAGLTDHICAWHACHRAARLFGGAVEFVLNSSGHVQTLVCAPDNPKAKYFTNPRLGTDPEAWRRSARENRGSWWDHWLAWLEKRSGEKRASPEALGAPGYPVIEPAPGTYVHQQP